jgi:hypothetical protein
MADYCEVTQIMIRAITKAFNDGIIAKELVIVAVSYYLQLNTDCSLIFGIS